MPNFVPLIAACLQIAVVWHLWRTKLLRRFPLLATFLASHAVWAIAQRITRLDTEWGMRAWAAGALVTMLTLLGAFLETVALSLEHYPGLSRRAIGAACGVVALFSLVAGALEPAYNTERGLFVAQRVLGLAVAMSAVGLVILLNYFDPRRRRNVVWHERIIAAMAATTSAAAWLNNHKFFAWGGTLLGIGSVLFPVLWIWAIRPEGEADTRPPANPQGRDQANAARDQLGEYYE
ncbi:MAG: hypothetical protein K2X03_06665 [Bryobacteraceae bacterium]|nr:hypothetical protein [Bryobacteraceae bacterium]